MDILIKELVRIANICDEKGFDKEADELDSIIRRLAQEIHVDQRGNRWTKIGPTSFPKGYIEWQSDKGNKMSMPAGQMPETSAPTNGAPKTKTAPVTEPEKETQEGHPGLWGYIAESIENANDDTTGIGGGDAKIGRGPEDKTDYLEPLKDPEKYPQFKWWLEGLTPEQMEQMRQRAKEQKALRSSGALLRLLLKKFSQEWHSEAINWSEVSPLLERAGSWANSRGINADLTLASHGPYSADLQLIVKDEESLKKMGAKQRPSQFHGVYQEDYNELVKDFLRQYLSAAGRADLIDIMKINTADVNAQINHGSPSHLLVADIRLDFENAVPAPVDPRAAL